MPSMIDFTENFIPHSRLIVREEVLGKHAKVDTFAPLPAIVAYFHATGYFPPSYHRAMLPINPSPEEIRNIYGG